VIRLALAGAGAHGRDHALAIETLRRTGRDARIDLVVDPVLTRARALAGEIGASHHGPPELLETVPVDAVIVCASTDAHLELAGVCAALAVPALIDKPLAATLEDADEIVATFAHAGVPLFPGQSTRFHPTLRRLKALIEDGELGDLGLIAAHHIQGYAWPGAWRAWQHDPGRSGGQIVHLGIHDIDLACWLAGSAPSRVRAVACRLVPGRPGSWASYAMQASFSNGALGLVTGSWDAVPADVQRKKCLVVGSAGRAGHDSARDEFAALPGRPPGAPAGYAIALRDQLGHWLDCLEQGAEPIVTPSQARTSLAVALATERSARDDGTPVAVEGISG
jgi:predicted dehydrogenase